MFLCRNCWCVCSDISGLLTLPLAYLQTGFVLYCTIFIVIYPMFSYTVIGHSLTALICLFAFLTTWCGIKAAFTEPGKVMCDKEISPDLIDYYTNEEAFNYCPKCNRLKPFRAHHCSKCKTCVLKMDHHCQWINNCVGARNQKYFILYLVYVHIGEMLASILGIGRIYYSRAEFPKHTTMVYLSELYPFNKFLPMWIQTHFRLPFFDAEIIPLIVLCIEVFISLLFAAFAVILFIDQMKAIRYDLTYVEYLKQYNMKTAENTFYDCLISCMGEPPCWRWFFPIQGKYLDAVIKKLSNEFLSFNENDYEDDYEEETLEEKKNK